MAHSYHNRKFSWIILAVAISTPRMRRAAPAVRRRPPRLLVPPERITDGAAP
jgi:hypothetical protein